MAADGMGNRALMPWPKQVEEVVYWTNPLVSGGVLLVGLFAFYLVGLCNYSSISVVCYVLILNLTVRLGHMHGGRVLGEMNVLPKRPLPVPPDHFVTEEQVAAHVGAITAQLNAVRRRSSPPPAGRGVRVRVRVRVRGLGLGSRVRL